VKEKTGSLKEARRRKRKQGSEESDRWGSISGKNPPGIWGFKGKGNKNRRGGKKHRVFPAEKKRVLLGSLALHGSRKGRNRLQATPLTPTAINGSVDKNEGKNKRHHGQNWDLREGTEMATTEKGGGRSKTWTKWFRSSWKQLDETGYYERLTDRKMRAGGVSRN